MGVALIGSATPGSSTPGGGAPATSATASAGQPGMAAGAFGAQGFAAPPPILRSTFLQPSLNAQYPNITWTQAQFEAEFQWMTSAGIKEIVLQWTVDQDANESYFPIGATTLPPYYNSMVGTCLAAAAACGVDVWLGLCNTSNWQAHANDNTWLYNQYYLNTVAATQIMSLYSGQFVGWYVSNEWSDTLYLDGSAYITASTAFFQDNTSWLRANTGLPVMTSPANYGAQSASAFAANIAAVCGSFDVINVQDGTGDVGFTASQVTSYFTALAAEFSGVPGVQLWQNADIYGYGTGLPITIPNLQANLAATTGLVSKYCSFSFETQMDPLTTSPVGNWSYYQAYRAYAKPYFDGKDATASPGVATAVATAYAPVSGVKSSAGLASAAMVSEVPKVALSCLPGVASAAFVSYAPVSKVSALPSVASATFVAYAPSGLIGAQAHPAVAGVTGTAEPASTIVTVLPGVASATLVGYTAAGSTLHSAYAGVAGITVTAYELTASVGAEPAAAAMLGAAAEAATAFDWQPVYPTTAMMVVTAVQPTVLAYSPSADRTYIIPFEPRAYVVPVETRVTQVVYEDRVEAIPYEDRVNVVPDEDRTDEVSGG